MPDHNSLLKKIARARLKPYAIFQKGQSRVFLQDHDFYTIMIEFQPSSGNRGTYLNIGADLHLYPRDFLAFGYGSREKGLELFENEEQFSALINDFCDYTLEKVKEINEKFRDIKSALATVEASQGHNPWKLYDIAMLNILNGNFSKARVQLQVLRHENPGYLTFADMTNMAGQVLSWLEDEATIITKVLEMMHETRKLKKLPEVSLNFLL